MQWGNDMMDFARSMHLDIAYHRWRHSLVLVISCTDPTACLAPDQLQILLSRFGTLRGSE